MRRSGHNARRKASPDPTAADPTRQFVRLALDTPYDTFHIIYATADQLSVDPSTVVPPNYPGFGGIEAADYIATQRAYFGRLLIDWDFVSITWKAVLSTNTVDARDHISVEGPVYNTNGDLVAHDEEDMWDGSIQNPVGYDEFGVAIPVGDDGLVWTGTASTGNTSFQTCDNWTDPGDTGGGQRHDWNGHILKRIMDTSCW